MSKRFFFLFLIVIALSACTSDDKSTIVYDLEGRWSIYEAYRDGDLTTTLEDGYFSFKDSILETNILGSPITGNYQLSEKSFRHASSLPVKYEIVEYSSDSMQLETEIRGFDFLFKLQKEEGGERSE